MPNNFRPIKSEISAAVSSTYLSFPSNESTHGMLLNFRNYVYEPGTRRGFSTLGGAASSNITSSIFLPLPSNIADSYEVRIDRFDQGMFGDAISQGGAMLGGGNFGGADELLSNMGLPSTDAMVGGVAMMAGGLSGFLSSKNIIGAGLGAIVGSGLDTSTISSSLEAGAGVMVNPKASLQFKGIEMKRHNFDWTFAPKSIDETVALKEIINTIKKNVLPSYTEGLGQSGAFQRALLKYPSFVDCFFVGIDPAYYFYFKPAMVQTFNVNYSPNGVSVLRGGRPASVSINMTLIESDIHTAEDYGGETSSLGSSFDAVNPNRPDR
jgi:hypothetical protein